MNAARIPYHPVVHLFPAWTEAERAAHYADFDENGIHMPIVKWQGQLIDGRGRYEYCLDRGIEPREAECTGTEEQAIKLGYSLNAKRRSLNESQRAMAAAGLVDLFAAAAARRRALAPRGANIKDTGKAAEKASKESGTPVRSIERASYVKKHASPETIEDINRGKLTVSEAERMIRAAKLRKQGKANSMDKAVRIAEKVQAREMIKCPHCKGTGYVKKRAS